MLPAVIAGLVKVQAPGHATHIQEEIEEFDGTDPNGATVRVRCSCSVGLTLQVPKTPAPAKKAKVDDGA